MVFTSDLKLRQAKAKSGLISIWNKKKLRFIIRFALFNELNDFSKRKIKRRFNIRG